MKISCVIPTKNRCQLTLAAIESVKRQHNFGIEIIVVDDGSTDNTLTEITTKFPEINAIKLHGVGPGQARNVGAAAAKGDILMFLDSDDLWLDNHVSQLVNVLERGFHVAYGVTQTRHETGGADFLIPDNGAGIEGDCFNALVRWCFVVPSAMALKRQAFREIGGFPSLYPGEDWVFFLRLAARFPFGFAGLRPISLRKLHRGSLCYLSDRKKLLAITGQVLTFLENEPRATAAHCNYFKMLHAWTAESKAQWSTVQEWYLAMEQEKII